MHLKEQYQQKKTTAAKIAREVQPDWVCATDIAASIPRAIMNSLGRNARARKTKGVVLHTMLDLAPTESIHPKAFPYITPVSWFSGSGLRLAANEGRGDIYPCYYRDMPQLIEQYLEPDAFFVTVAPMDKHGYFSTGVVGSTSIAMIHKAKRIYLEVNKETPRVPSAPQIHISQVTALCEHHAPLPVFSPAEVDKISGVIGGYIAEEICNGATLQLGIGAVPEAVGLLLKDKKDLGIHTELLTDSMVELIECGAVTNMEKPIHQGKTVATLAFGSERIYRFLDDNPSVEMLPVDYVNDPAVIAQHPHFVSVNAALEVDFYGQVCAESVGTRHVSGSGGQADYVRGATQSRGGKSFIAFPSTAKHETLSRIKPTLTPGAIITTSKNDVDYIVTEYGIAKLRGKSLSQRAKALIAIAHPKFRDALLFEARKENILV